MRSGFFSKVREIADYRIKGVMMVSRLLILSCSQRKRPNQEELPAIERYNGPIFQILHKYLRENPVQSKTLDTFIFSAKFGLIPANKLIPNYDQKLTRERAQELNPQILENLSQILRDERCYQELFINLGETYWRALDGYKQIIPSNLKVKKSQGSQGRRQVELRDWLYSSLQELPAIPTTKTSRGKVRIRGIEIDLAPDQIFDLTREKLGEDQKGATNYQAWYVQIDDQQVAPKWIVSQLTGLAVSSFHSSEARQVLQQLGVEVHKV